MPRLFHFSEDPGIERFVPREELRRADAPPLVWAIDEAHAHMYLFPRDCPRILLWPLPDSSPEDVERWFGRSEARVIAHIEYAWLERMRSTALYRYELPPDTFEDLREAVTPRGVEPVGDLFEALNAAGVELRVLPRLSPLHGARERTTLHCSAIRLAHAIDWPQTESSPMPRGFRRV